MSGIVGIINLDGAPVDRELLGRMTNFMSFRGPDAQEIWIDGNVGFGHTMLRTTFEAETEKQPLTLDGKVWLTADARIDGRDELIAELEGKLQRRLRITVASNGYGSPSKQHTLPSNAHGPRSNDPVFVPNGHSYTSNGHGSDDRMPNDAELILYSYEAWGEDCVKHLIGDFAFAIWDSRQRRLFCARDHFGVKPFYYAQVSNSFIFSNTLNCLRFHPEVSDRLNDRFIGDFLLFDMCRDPAITVFEDIARLLPAHCLTMANEQTRLKRYWTLTPKGDVRYRRERDYIDRFNELFDRAVSDRLRTDKVGVFMSGGLDSTTVATVAHDQLSKQRQPFDLRAYTAVYDKLFKDEERYYSSLVADKLNVPIHYLATDDYDLYERSTEHALRSPEPSHQPLGAISYDQCLQAAGRSRVVLTGYGLDPAISPSHSHGIDLIKSFRFAQLAHDMAWFVYSRGQLPRIGFRSWLKRVIGYKSEVRYGEFPAWLDPKFAFRTNLEARWQEINDPRSVHRKRREGYQSLTGPFWAHRFESDDPGVSSIACEHRHPYFDLHLICYLLAIPEVPWCVGKELIRRAMHGRLPEPVRLRPKTVLAGDPILARHKRRALKDSDQFKESSELREFIVREAIPNIEREEHSLRLWINMRPFTLDLWLKTRRTITLQSQEEISYGFTRQGTC